MSEHELTGLIIFLLPALIPLAMVFVLTWAEYR